MKLNPATIQQLVSIRAEISKLEKQDKKLSDKIKAAMKSQHLEEYAPETSPFKLVRSEYPRSNVTWKDQWKKLAKKAYDDWKKKMEQLQKKYTQDVVSLTIEPNENYRNSK